MNEHPDFWQDAVTGKRVFKTSRGKGIYIFKQRKSLTSVVER